MLVSRGHVSRSLLQYTVLVPHVCSRPPTSLSSKKMIFSFFLAGKYSNNYPNPKISIERLLNSCNRSFPFITRRVFFLVSETIAWKNEEQLPKAIEKFPVICANGLSGKSLVKNFSDNLICEDQITGQIKVCRALWLLLVRTSEPNQQTLFCSTEIKSWIAIANNPLFQNKIFKMHTHSMP